MFRASGVAAIAAKASTQVHAVPLSPAEVTKLCAEAEGLAQCGRLVEAEQLKRLPGLAVREGSTLRVTLFPAGSVTFTDSDTRSGGSSFALWDHYSTINATLLFTTKDDDAGFVLLQRATGKQTMLPSEPVLAPDRERLATADFCESRCENRLVVWRIARDGAYREVEWKPSAPWADAAVRWKDPGTLEVEYTPLGATETRTLQRKLGDASWFVLAR